MSTSLRPRGQQHARLPCPSPTPGVYSDSCSLSQWCHPTIWASTSVLPMNIQDWFPLGLTGWISLQSKGLSRVFSNTTVQKHRFFDTQPSYGSTLTSIHDYWKNHSFDWTDGPLSTEWCLCFLISCLGLS